MTKYVIKKNTASRNAVIDYEKELNPEQLAVVRGADGPCLVLAGAGSGKTRTIVYRVAHLIERGASPDRILLLTFTNKAAKEMLSRVEALLGHYPKGLWGGTFHSVANRILRKYAARAGFKSNFTILDEEDAKGIIKICVKDLNIDTKMRRFPSPAVLKNIISYSGNSLEKISHTVGTKHPNHLELINDIEAVAVLYQKKKSQANAMDFDDLLLNLSKLLREDSAFCEKLSQGFQYILVDEYQDTNVIQARIVTSLAKHHKNILVVGDDAQSIYSFRAANLRNILDFPKIYPGAKTFRLETNYRSTPEILDLANTIIEKNIDQFPKELRSIKKQFVKPSLVPAASGRQEAEYIAQMILELRDEGINLNDIAVLFRASHHSQELEVELVKRDIPYEYRGGVKFFERAHIKDVLSYLRIYKNLLDEAAWQRALSMQTGIGPVAASKIYAAARGLNEPAEVAALKAGEILEKRAQSGWRNFLSIWQDVIKSDDLPASLIRAVNASEYQKYLESQYPNWRDRAEDLEQLAVFAEQYKDLSLFLNEISLYDDFGVLRQEQTEYDDENIILSTIHQAKGLEWPVVFVMHLTDQGFPNKRALIERGGLEEERRLFYVAATRAADQLYLTYPLTSGYDNLIFNQASVFLQEIPENLLERVELENEQSISHAVDDGEPTIVWDE
ncbi:ATP-dependent helicase [Patescibacteria group bacterium]|nr:ATP-dependent helicase [Patescibacteria group bacterium]